MNNMDHIFGISGLIVKHLSGALSSDEQQSLDTWLKEDEKHTAIFNRIVAHKSLAAALVEIEQINTELALANVKTRITALAQHKSVRLWPRITVVAAAIAAIVFGVWFYRVLTPQELRSKTVQDDVVVNDIAPGKNGATITLANGKVIALSDAKTGVVIGDDELKYSDGTGLQRVNGKTGGRKDAGDRNDAGGRDDVLFDGGVQGLTASTAKGQTYQFTLADGTKVWLNADSKLEFPSKFVNGKTRNVRLVGEGYFEVSKDKAHPFIVESGKQKVEVLGTQFNISSYQDEALTRTTLVEGSVRIVTDRSMKILKPNDQAVLYDGKINVSEANIEETVAWKNGDFVFEGERIKRIMQKLARWYNIEVVYEGKITEEGFYGQISRKKNISEVLALLEQAQGVRFEISGRRVTVKQ